MKELYVINPLITDGKHKVYIFGTGRRGTSKLKELNLKGITVSGFIDRKMKRNGKVDDIYGVRLYNEDEFEDKEACVIIASNSWREIKERLELKGFTNIFIDNNNSQHKEIEIKDGYILEIAGIKLKTDMVYICCAGHIGDTMSVAALIKAYKEQKGIDRVCLIVRKNLVELVQLFSAVDEVIASSEIIDRMRLWSEEMQIFELRNYLFGFPEIGKLPYGMKNKYYKMPNAHISVWWKDVLGISLDSKYESMRIPKLNSRPMLNAKSVLLMPYAQSDKLLPMSWWKELADELKEKGYICFTNAYGPYENEIEGTQRYEKDIVETVAECKNSYAVIGSRSGMMDVLALAGANLIVLNSTYELLEHFDLTKMVNREGIVNMVCNDKSEKEIINDILSAL